MDKQNAFILWFDQISNDDVAFVGGKNASLGEMYRTLTPQGVRVPNGFAITAKAYQYFLDQSGLREAIQKELAGLDTSDITALQHKGKVIRKAFIDTELPADLSGQIVEAYRNLSNAYNTDAVDTAVRSSATAEDLPGASFAGEHETFLNVHGDENVLAMVRAAFASLFTDRAISYRVDKGFEHDKISLSVGVQKMVRSDLGASGVMFTLDTETGFRDVVTINASWGLGEMVVQGKVTPDEFMVYKPALREGFTPVIKKNLGPKTVKMVYTKDAKSPVKEVKTTHEEQTVFSLTDTEVLELARWGLMIEEHYTARAGHPMPMDMEWAKDGERNELYIVQARPETVQSEKKGFVREEYKLTSQGKAIVEGISVGAKIATGKARIILSTKKLSEFEDGEILITEITDPDWEPIMKKASAIVTEKGGRTSHAAIVSRELGIAAVVGAKGAVSKIKTGDIITVDTSSGDVGKIYEGELTFEKKTYNLSEVPHVKTKIAVNVGTPDGAFMYGLLPHHGVGLAREEFIIASHIKVHPLALLGYDKLESADLKKKIDKIVVGYPSRRDFYIRKLAEGIAQIAAAFAPYQVIVRFSDFKTNEYRSLLGGEEFEPEEENPMLGWRGASRYAHPNFKPAFELECEAIKVVRNEFGLKNLQVMIPFCRTPDEGRKVVETMKEFGLVQGSGEKDLKIFVMCEIPANVLRADEFLDIFDGFSIGSNDLSQLTLGIDRDSSIVAGISNENDPAVRTLVSQAIQACKRRGKYIGICGQAPSDYPDFLRFLVREGIESISLNADSIVPMLFEVAEEEKLMQQ